ncbi:MAG: transglutaminase family protein [Porcipelethomonas sp.]
MKKNTTDNSSGSGIKIVNNINMSVPGTREMVNRIPLMLTAFMGIFGTVFSFFTMFGIDTGSISAAFYTLLFFGVFTAFFMLPRKLHLLIIPVMAVYGLLLYRMRDKFVLGFKLLYNKVYNSIYPKSGSYFKVSGGGTENIEVFAVFAIFLIAVIICYNVYTQPNFFTGFLLTFAIVETGFYFGKAPGIIYAFMLITFWVSLLALGNYGYCRKFSSESSGFVRRDNCFTAKPSVRFRTAGSTVSIITAICFLIFLLTAVITNLTGYERPEKLDTMRTDMKLAASEFSFENFGESLERLSASLGFNKYKSFSHRLGNVGSVKFKDTTELTVETDGSFSQNIYLKGYTGTVYSGDEWETFPESLYQSYEDMFEGFQREKSFPQDMLTNYILNKFETEFISLSVKSDYQNEEYNYVPYVSIPKGEITYVDDTLSKLASQTDYSFMVSTNQAARSDLEGMLALADDTVNDTFDEYTGFVYDNYLSYPDNDGTQELYDRLVKGTELETGEDVYRKLMYISEILSENAEYSLNPGVTPGIEDFVNYFLLKNHKGFCVHFATAGVILARMAGIPARYADGYVLCADEFNDKNKNDDGTYTVKIEDSRAHAWAEIYIENLGWVPFEFTPSSAAVAALSQDPSQSAVMTEPASSGQTNKTTVTKAVSETVSTTTMKNTAAASGALSITSSADSSMSDSKPMSLKARVILIFVLAVLAAVAFIIARRVLWERKKKLIFGSTDERKKITYAYTLTVRLLEFCGAEKNNMQYLEYAEYVCQKLPEIADGGFTALTEKMLRAQVSGEQPEISEGEYAAGYYKSVYRKIYTKANPVKKLSMSWVKKL